jgi:hypothetical protein
MNKYLAKYKKRKEGSNNVFSTAYDYWTQKGLTGGISEAVDAASDYSETVEAEDRRNEKAYNFKLELARKYKKAGAWPDNVEKRFIFVGKAYPDLPSVSTVLGVAPNSEADSYAQGALVSYISALLFPEHKNAFTSLGDDFYSEAQKGNNQQDGPRTQKTAKEVARQWDAVAIKSGILSSWYNLIGQAKNLMNGNELQARQIESRLDLFSRANEINLAQQIAKESQSSVTDVLYQIRGWLALGGTALALVYLWPVVGPMIFPTARKIGTATAKMLNNRVYKPLSGAMKDVAENKKEQAMDKIAKVIEDKSLDFSSKIKQDVVKAQQNAEGLSEEEIKRIVKAIVNETEQIKARLG